MAKNIGRYEMVYAPEADGSYDTGLIPKHRLIAQQKLGRPLAKTERVSFYDGDRSNCLQSNLIVLKSRADVLRFNSRLRDDGLIKLGDGSYTYDPSVWKQSDQARTYTPNGKTLLTRAELLAIIKSQKSPTLASIGNVIGATSASVHGLLVRYNITLKAFSCSTAEARQTFTALQNCGGMICYAAQQLKIGQVAMRTRMRLYGINVVQGRVMVKPVVRVPEELFRRAAYSLSAPQIADELGTSEFAVYELSQLYEVYVHERLIRQTIQMSTSLQDIKLIKDYLSSHSQIETNEHFKGKYSLWVISQVAHNAEKFSAKVAGRNADVINDVVNELRKYAANCEQIKTTYETSIADELKVVGQRESESTADVQTSKPLPTVSEQLPTVSEQLPTVSEQLPTTKSPITRRRVVAKRDLRDMLSVLTHERCQRVLGVSEADFEQLLVDYHLDQATVNELNEANKVLLPFVVDRLRGLGHSTRDIAAFYGLRESVVRLTVRRVGR